MTCLPLHLLKSCDIMTISSRTIEVQKNTNVEKMNSKLVTDQSILSKLDELRVTILL